MSDISGILSGTGVALEAQAFSVFGAAVQGNVSTALGNIFGQAAGKKLDSFPGNLNQFNPNTQQDHNVWDPTDYSLAEAPGSYDPKQKFLFKVHFDFYPGAAKQAGIWESGIDSTLGPDLTYSIKQIDLPKYSFQYEEVNMYNFRTKILKKIEHEELSFTFYDNVANHSLRFLSVYLKMLMPITRQEWPVGFKFEDHGMDFNRDMLKGLNSGMRQVLLNGDIDILRTMRIDQFYLDRSQQHLTGSQINQAIKVNSFIFTNPRLTKFSFTDHDHEKSDVGMVTCSFDYDALNMITDKEGTSRSSDHAGLMEARDILTGHNPTSAPGNGPQSTVNRGGGGGILSPFMSIIANQGQRLVGTTITNAINKTGMGSIAGGALSGPIGSVATAFGSNAFNTIRAAGSGSIGSGISLKSFSFVKDNSASQAQANANSSQIISNDIVGSDGP